MHCVGQKDEVNGMQWWEQLLSSAQGLGGRLDAEQSMQQGSK